MMGFQQFHLRGSSKNYQSVHMFILSLILRDVVFSPLRTLVIFTSTKMSNATQKCYCNFVSKKRLSVEGIEKRKKKVSEF